MAAKKSSWFDPVPLTQPYPWWNLEIPEVSDEEEKRQICLTIKEKGDESFGKEDYLDALWKYEHALGLADDHPSLRDSVALIGCSAAQSCLRLGDSNSCSLIQSEDIAHWYYSGYHLADAARSLNPSDEVASKIYRTRGECLQRIQHVEPTNEKIKFLIQNLLMILPPTAVVQDYVTSFKLNPENVHSLYAAVLEATRTGQTSCLPILTKKYAELNVGTKLLKQMFSSSNISSVQLRCLLVDMKTDDSDVKHFNASEVNPAILLDKEVYDIDLYRKLVHYGIHITHLFLEKAVEVLSEKNLELFKLLLIKSTDKDYQHVRELTLSSNKNLFLDAVDVTVKEVFQDLKKKGDNCLTSGAHQEALNNYQVAIDFCQKHNMQEENATIHISCAQACLNLQRYCDAYEHSAMCIEINPQNHNGYYQRAEALISSLELFLTDSLGTYGDVVKDYLKCHDLHDNIDAYCKAIVVAVNNGCFEVIPKLSSTSTSKDFINQILLALEEKYQLTEPILEFILFDLPDDKDACLYDASKLSFSNLICITTRLEIFKLLLKCGLPISDNDIVEAIRLLDTEDSNDVSLLEFLILNCNKTDSFQQCLDEACMTAMGEEENDFVMVLIKHGARPRPRDFVRYAGQNIQRTIRQRLFTSDVMNSFRTDLLLNVFSEFTAREEIEELRSKAKRDMRLKKMNSAEKLLLLALKICEDYHVQRHLLILHRDLAQLYLQIGQFRDAYVHSQFLVILSSRDSEGYVYSAESVRRGLEKGTFSLSTPIVDVYHIISSYRVAYEIDSSQHHLVEALLVASKNDDMLKSLSRECSKLNSFDCTKLMQELIKRDCNPNGLRFLMELWKDTKTIKYSSLNLKSILAMSDPEENLISELILHGMKVNSQVFASAIQNLPDSKMNVLKLLEKKCETLDIECMCEAALKAQKINFMLYFIESGAKWPKHQVEILQDLWKDDNLSGFEQVLKFLTSSMINGIDIVSFISAKPSCYKYITLLLNSGIHPDSKKSSVVAVKRLKTSIDIKVDLITSLIRGGADCNKLCNIKKTSPLNVATVMAIESKGKTQIIVAVAHSPYFNRNQTVDERRETPLHKAVAQNVDVNISLKVLKAVIQLGILDPTISNAFGKKCIDLVKSNDPRAVVISDYIRKWECKYCGHHDKSIAYLHPEQSAQKDSNEFEQVPPAIELQPYKDWKLQRKLTFHIDRVSKDNESYIKSLIKNDTAMTLSPSNTNLCYKKSQRSVSQSTSEEERMKTIKGLLNFDDLLWEVEVTEKVVKYFQNVSYDERMQFLEVIHLLAEGIHDKLLEKVVANYSDIYLYQTQINKVGKVLWQIAISFSSRNNVHSQYPVYVQVIRVWDVLFDQESFSDSVHCCINKIKKHIKCGYKSLDLLSLPDKKVFKNDVWEHIHYPISYTLQSDVSDGQFTLQVYHSELDSKFEKFYVLDDTMVKTLIVSCNDRNEYLLKLWPEQHKVININLNEPLILIGVKNTGKTTCGFFRLWNEFSSYWNQASATFKCSRFIGSSTDTHEVKNVVHEACSKESNCDKQYKDLCGENITENLHQIFITRNGHICDHIKKTFYNVASAHDFLVDHLSFENSAIPNSFRNFEDLSFPAFLTAMQFYIILDNSLGNSNHFFRRNSEGDLQVKITSLDYGHDGEEMVSKLLEKSCDDKIGEVTRSKLRSGEKSGVYAEVTALYFKEVIWPEISQECEDEASIDPMLVWLEIQHFIKGSVEAVLKGSPLSLEEYIDIDKSMAPIFFERRELIYRLYLCYHQYINDKSHICYYLFDLNDLVLDVHQRLKMTKDLGWSVHSVYVDEIQDFCQAEIAVFIHCCKNPNSVFIAGDVGHNKAFQLHNIQKYFHQLRQVIPEVHIPSNVYTLTNNCHLHCNLASYIGDLVGEQLQDTEYLHNNSGLCQGSIPVFLDCCNEDDLFLALSANKPEQSHVDFGACQVILLQSCASKEKLPEFLENSIVFTISEANGMQFEDVLLYNFFADSKVDMKVWKDLALLEKAQLTNKGDQSIGLFNSVQRESFNLELKQLYQVIACTKHRLWIYDSCADKNIPLLQNLQQKEVLQVLTADMISSSEDNYVFASKSTPSQWKKQGDYFQRRNLWEQATMCYKKAGPESLYLLKVTEGYKSIEAYCHSKDQQDLQVAALNFLESDYLSPSLKCIRTAAFCLVDSVLPMYHNVCNCLESTGDLDKATQMYLRNGDYDNFVRIQEGRGEYESVIQALSGKFFKRKEDVLKKAREYESKGFIIDSKYSTKELSFARAKFYLSLGDNQALIDVLRYMPEFEKRFKFLKRAKLYEKAYGEALSMKQVYDAYQLALGQGWLGKAINLSRKQGDSVRLAQFTLLQAKLHYSTRHKGLSQVTAEKKIISMLKKLIEEKNHKVCADAELLLGMILRSQEYIRSAIEKYKQANCKAGILESFELLKEVSNQEILYCCQMIKKLSQSLRDGNDLNIDLQRTMKFYGFQFIGSTYLTTQYGHCFIKYECIEKYKCDDTPVDLDNMLRIQPEIKEMFAQRFEDFAKVWKTRYNLESAVYSKCQSFILHAELWKNRHLSHQYTPEEVSVQELLEYISNCLCVLEYKILENQNVEGMLAHFEVIFSPHVSMCLLCLNKSHVNAVRQTGNCIMAFKRKIEDSLIRLKQEGVKISEKMSIDSWLNVWRLSSISCPDMKILLDGLEEKELLVNDKQQECNSPLGFISWNGSKQYLHIFHFWLSSCIVIKHKLKAIQGIRLAIVHFLGNIIESKCISISIPNIVSILTIHCTALLALMLQASKSAKLQFAIPHTHKHVVELFDNMNCDEKLDCSVFQACAKEAASCLDCQRLVGECKYLLNRALSYLIGTFERAPKYSVLRFALHKYTDTDHTLQCLILALTVFANLSMVQSDVSRSERKLMKIFMELKSKCRTVPEYIQNVLVKCVDGIGKPHRVIKLVEDCLKDSRKDATLCTMVYNYHLGDIEVTPVDDWSQTLHRSTDYDIFQCQYDEGVDENTIIIFDPRDRKQDLDPNLISDDIIDYENNFCIPCGVHFIHDSMTKYESGIKQTLELWSVHVSGRNHATLSEEFKLFLSSLRKDSLVTAAKQKLKEFSLLPETSEANQLEYAIDNLEDEISRYEFTVAKIKEQRNWREGLNAINKSIEILDRLLKMADEQIRAYKHILVQKNIDDSLELDETASAIEMNSSPSKNHKTIHSAQISEDHGTKIDNK